MDEQQVRDLVREALARHLARDGSPSRPSPPNAATWKAHLSHGRFVFLAPAEPNEPQVRCHHCGFCQSYGH